MNEKIVKIVSNITEKKRMNNVIRSVEFTLDYVASLGHSASKSNSSGFDFSYEKKILLYSLYRPKKLIKQLHKSLADII